MHQGDRQAFQMLVVGDYTRVGDHLAVQRDGAPQQGLGPNVITHVLVQDGKVVECGDVGFVPGIEHLREHLQGSSETQVRLHQIAHLEARLAQPVQAQRRLRVVFPQFLAPQQPGLAEPAHRFGVISQGPVKHPQIVQAQGVIDVGFPEDLPADVQGRPRVQQRLGKVPCRVRRLDLPVQHGGAGQALLLVLVQTGRQVDPGKRGACIDDKPVPDAQPLGVELEHLLVGLPGAGLVPGKRLLLGQLHVKLDMAQQKPPIVRVVFSLFLAGPGAQGPMQGREGLPGRSARLVLGPRPTLGQNNLAKERLCLKQVPFVPVHQGEAGQVGGVGRVITPIVPPEQRNGPGQEPLRIVPFARSQVDADEGLDDRETGQILHPKQPPVNGKSLPVERLGPSGLVVSLVQAAQIEEAFDRLKVVFAKKPPPDFQHMLPSGEGLTVLLLPGEVEEFRAELVRLVELSVLGRGEPRHGSCGFPGEPRLDHRPGRRGKQLALEVGRLLAGLHRPGPLPALFGCGGRLLQQPDQGEPGGAPANVAAKHFAVDSQGAAGRGNGLIQLAFRAQPIHLLQMTVALRQQLHLFRG